MKGLRFYTLCNSAIGSQMLAETQDSREVFVLLLKDLDTKNHVFICGPAPQSPQGQHRGTRVDAVHTEALHHS